MSEPDFLVDPEDIAIVGMSCRFPGAANIDMFWSNLRAGVETITFFSDAELLAAGIDSRLLRNPHYVKAHGVLEDIDLFDAAFFGFTAREAEITDPQHRIFLECAWEALEHAGYDSEQYAGLIGIYAGASMSAYMVNIVSNRDIVDLVGNYQITLGNDKDFLPTRVSYKLNLQGPSMSIQTACSTSLVAVCLAYQSLLNYQCDIALAGGVSISVPQKAGYIYQEGGILAPDGHCRSFDVQAQGTVGGDGVGVVVLKRLADALTDGDTIHAVIKGAALNNDGATKLGFTAPSIDGQSAVITLAHMIAQVDPATITYVEAHGTATPMGDPIEVAALTQAFRRSTDRVGYCALGSVKTNLGHLDAAAGVAGLIKTVLALKHQQIPPSLHFEQPNPQIDFVNSPFYVNNRLIDWHANAPRRAGVSSFGIGGTNAHIILEQAPPIMSNTPAKSHHLLVLSAQTRSALEAATTALVEHLKQHPNLNLGDVAYTLQVGRKAFNHRRVLVCQNLDEAVAAMEQRDAKRVLNAVQEHKDRPVAFLFPGQGTQYLHMARELYEAEITFRSEIDRCAELLQPDLGIDLRCTLYPDTTEPDAAAVLNQTAITQPALFVVEYALASMWMAMGIQPQAMLGHSIGEYVAACLAGVMTLKEALHLVAIRGRLMQSLSAGGMLAIPLAEHELPPLHGQLSLAAVNGPASCVVSGPIDAIEAFAEQLAKRGTDCRRLYTSHAFHSEMVEPIMAPFIAHVERIALKPPVIPYISNVTGAWITAEQATDPGYWASHLRQTVRFADGLRLLVQASQYILLEVGPGQTLNTLVRLHSEASAEQVSLPSLRRPQDQTSDLTITLTTLGRLWLAGAAIDWTKWYGDNHCRRIPLPTYPFERKRYWIAAARIGDNRAMPSETGQMNQEMSLTPTPAKHSAPTAGKETSMTNTQVAVVPTSARTPRIASLLQSTFGLLFAVDPASIDANTTFLEMGADSLFLLQASQAIQNTFGIRLPFRLLLEELSTIQILATYIDQQLPPEEHAVPMPKPPLPAAAIPAATAAPQFAAAPPAPTSSAFRESLAGNVPINSSLEQIIAQQLKLMDQQSQIMQQQLEIVRGAPIATASALLSATSHTAPPQPQTIMAFSQNGSDNQVTPPPRFDLQPSSVDARSKPFVPYQPIRIKTTSGLSDRQQRHLDELIARLNTRTRTSKQLTQAYRPALADNRATAGFRLAWKEIVYPLIVQHAAGARIWDADGNEYVDIAMGYGALLFGHSAPFVIKALEEQIKHGVGIGPHTHLAGQVAELIHELTGMERAAFCNSGTEAVMAALRLARTVTGRAKIVVFAGSYHGTFDGTMAMPQEMADGSLRAIPMCPGVTPNLIADVMILEFGTQESLNVLRAHMHELAAVLVEPTQSRQPQLQPIEFLTELRQLTREAGAALIFDEVITGFRMHPGGIQGLYDIKADLTTYGKAIGGGMPVGVIAGSATYMDAIDGGMWQYGDGSFPEALQTFFTGTYFKHPFVMAVVLAVLKHLKQSGPQLQEHLNQRTTNLAATLNAAFKQQHIPMELVHFGSLFRFIFGAGAEHSDLFFHYLLEQGVYTWEGRTCYLSTAHTDEDITQIIKAVLASAQRMRDGGFFPDPSAGFEEPAPTLDKTLRQPAPATAAKARRPSPAAVRTLPLTDAQKELWAFAHMEIDAARAYSESVVLRLQGPLKLAVMQRSIQAIIDRHAALRTTFSPEGDYQYIHPSRTLEIPLLDFSGSDMQAAEAQVSAWLTQESQRPFDFVQGPLLRVAIVQLTKNEHLVALIYHHIIADGLSLSILLNELSALYSAECQGLVCQLPQPMQYSEYTEAQMYRQQGPEMETAEKYWLDRFGDAAPILELPTDHPRPSSQTYRGAQIQQKLNSALYQELKTFSTQSGNTLFVALLSAFTILLHRLSRQNDIVIGVPATGRSFTGDEYLVGHCVNLLPIRSTITGNPTFTEYLTAAKKAVLDGYDHQHYPFRKLVKKLRLIHNQQQMPIVSVTFNMDQSAELYFFELLAVAEPAPVRYTNFDLNWNITQTEHDLTIDCKYNTDLFDLQTIQRWIDYFQVLLEGILAQHEQRVHYLPLLTAKEWTELVITRNATAQPYPSASCFHQLFAQQVERTPSAIAVIYEDIQLTYCELDQRANQLAQQLQQLGVTPNTPVALCLDRSIELLIALLGIFKAGGAFLPLDPAFPAERMAFMLDDAQAPVLLTQTALLSRLPPFSGVCLRLDRDWAALVAQQPTTPPISSVTAADLAYIIYTSGSTGRPKGVLVSHRGLLNYLYWCIEAYGAAHGRGAPVHASIAADAIFPGLFAPLLVGAATVMLPEEQPLEALAAIMQQPEPFSMIKITPSQLSALNHLLPPNKAAGSVRTLVVGAEEVRGEVLNFWQTHAPATILLNEYGPTETVVGCSIYQVPSGQYRSGTVPIGLPIANTQFYVLDRYLQPAPLGTPGELYIGGDGVAWGYLNRPTLTAEKFIPDPFSGQPGARLYKTGDLVRQLANRAGNIEFLGRQDDQVKIRGYRVELGEVETVLRRHPAVRDVVVLAREDAPGDRRLVAYVVPQAKHTLTVEDVRQHVQERLPLYMAPAAVMLLDALPLAPHGKIDRKALPVPDHTRPALQYEFVAPITPTERQLAHLWARVLEIDRVGVHDNFFDLGGDSILSIRIIAKANESGLRLKPRDLFQHPTVAELAAVVDAALDANSDPTIVTGPLPLTPIQHWFFEQNWPTPHYFNQAALLETPPDTDPILLEQAVQHLVLHHSALRLRVQPTVDGWQAQLAALDAPIALAQIDLSAISAPEQAAALAQAAAEFHAGLDITTGPLLRAAYFTCGSAAAGRLLLVIHHLAIDVLSWHILRDELEKAYHQLQHGQPVSLPPKTTSLRMWAEHLVAYAQSPMLALEQTYWLDPARSSVAPLPVDYPAGVNTVGSARMAVITLSAAETQVLLYESPRVHHTQMSEVLLTALALALGRWTGQRLVLVDLESHGREELFADVDLSRTVGWFTTLHPALLDLRKASEPSAAIQAIKAQLRATPHGGIGYGALRYLRGDPVLTEALRALPQAQILFNYTGRFDEGFAHDALFRAASESSGPSQPPNAPRTHLLEIGGFLAGGQLQLELTYSEQLHKRETIDRLAQYFLDALHDLIEHIRAPDAGSLIPSDFPLANLDAEKFSRLAKLIGQMDQDQSEAVE